MKYTKEGRFLLGILLVIFLSVLVSSHDSAPQAFNGEIIVLDGSLSNGLTLVGKIDGIATGSALILDNKYDIVVVDYTGPPFSGEITFEINGEVAQEVFSFEQFKITKTNLTFETIPREIESCGDGICNYSECSYCAIDCSISECINGICESGIGETCSNSPDCICDDGSDSGSGGSSGSGSGGSSSGGSNLVTTTQTPDLTQSSSPKVSVEVEEEDPFSIDEMNTKNEKTNFFSGITGAVIGFDFSNGKGFLFFAVLSLIVLALLVLKLRKKTTINSNIKETVSETKNDSFDEEI